MRQCRQNTTGCDCDTHYTNQSWSPQNHLPSHNSRTFWSLDLKQQYSSSGGGRPMRGRAIDWIYRSWLQLPSVTILQLCKAIYVAVDSESMCTQFSIPKVQTVEKASFLGSICAASMWCIMFPKNRVYLHKQSVWIFGFMFFHYPQKHILVT